MSCKVQSGANHPLNLEWRVGPKRMGKEETLYLFLSQCSIEHVTHTKDPSVKPGSKILIVSNKSTRCGVNAGELSL